VTDRLASASARVRTVRGDAAVAWSRADDTLEVEIVVPDTARADVWLPMPADGAATVVAADLALWPESAPAIPSTIRDVRRVDDFLRLEVGGGTHRFRVTSS
jgi:alpha-L-rhamnosidase